MTSSKDGPAQPVCQRGSLLDGIFKGSLRRLLGPRIVGYLDYYRFPERRGTWGGPFNGQEFRQALFQQLIQTVMPAAIVETGTYLGTTTELFAGTGLPVFTIEGHARNYGFARARLRRYRNVALCYGDSRTQLKRLFDGPLASFGNKNLFCYLDAHWNDDLPLAEELDIIFSRSQSVIVMIDDFQVPGDSGYSYDDYGPGKVLNSEYINPAVQCYGLALFLPATPSREETGARRGCAVLCREAMLDAISLLRRV
jgi:hypothetical protein